jgi:hypothetical protein
MAASTAASGEKAIAEENRRGGDLKAKSWRKQRHQWRQLA